MDLWDQRVANRLDAARRAGQLRDGADPHAVALGLMAIIEGLIRNWLLGRGFDLLAIGRSVTGQYLDALRA